MTHQPANRPRIAATYASGTVRARRWHGDGDVRGPSAAWLDGPRRPDRSASPHGPRLAARRVVDHRNQGITSRTGPKPCRLGAGGRNSGRGGGRARFHCSKPKRPIAAFGQAAMGLQGARARNPRSQQVWRRIAPPTIDRRNGRGWCGYAPACCGRLHERAVPDAGGSLSVRHERRFTDTPPSLASMSFHTTPQYVAVSCGRGALALSSGH